MITTKPTSANFYIKARKRDGRVIEGYVADDGLASLLCVDLLEGGCAYLSVLDTVLERVQIGADGRYAIAGDARFAV